MSKIIKGVIGMLLALFFMGYGIVSVFQGELIAGIIQFGFGGLVFLGGLLMAGVQIFNRF